MQSLLFRFAGSADTAALLARLAAGGRVTASGLISSGRSFLAVAALGALRRTVVLVLDDEHSARAVLADIHALAPDQTPLYFDPGAQGLALRLNSKTPVIIVAPAPDLNRPAPLPDQPDSVLEFTAGADAGVERITGWLEANGYERTDLVTEPGDYAARGGIIDLFASDADLPVRVELAGDRVDSIRSFDPLLQRSRARLDKVAVPTRKAAEQADTPASTLLPRDAVLITEGPVVPAFATVEITGEPDADFNLGCATAGSFVGNLDQFRTALATAGDAFIVCAAEHQCARLATIIGAGPRYLVGPLSAGFACDRAGYSVFTEREIYGTPFARPVRHKFKGLPVDNIVSLRPGDLVVHIDYGVGRFEGTRHMRHGDTDKDFVVISYAGADKVYVPVENLGLLDRYVGGDEGSPALDRLGGRGWLIAKAKAAKASAEYAEQLLEVYARRAVARGIAFGADGPWQAELEASFPFDETPDQLRVLADVKRDMEQSKPMDRLVCGDVGYGKTEVALRAAFKAATAGKQVAILAPTTILCYQHYVTFRRRLARFPLRVEMLSRFVGPTRQREVFEGLKNGTVDIVIGTHQLLGSRIKFHDLGLLVIDEEQKFGVRQKERIRSYKAAVDVLTLTATPIPRTLYMGMAGLRDISQINTPPPGRREIHTDVSAWNDALIQEYVRRELDRGGQVFFVHNEIQSIYSIAERLQRLLPGVTTAIGHGRMSGRDLADIYLNFAAGEYQMLLSTAIIESGLDMPNVNTIIVNRADRFGLSDLHQLRGRVGRSQEQAYALFLVPAQEETTMDARKRLSALLAYSKLGSGFKLAVRDMEIRGVGNLLGLEQHGHVARVGFTLYAQMLKEAVAKLKGEAFAVEPELSLDVPAYIPEAYVGDSFERVALYKRLLAVETEAELAELKVELNDRFGKYPDSVEPLFQVSEVRLLARKHGLLKVSLKKEIATIVGPEKTTTVRGGMTELLDWLRRA